MNIHPNCSKIDVEIVEIAKCADGWGSNVRARVIDPGEPTADDFLQAKTGQDLEIFAADDSCLEVGERVRVSASLMGGPMGERLVLREASRL